MSLLPYSSSAARSMSSKRANSPMMLALTSRRDLLLGKREGQKSNKDIKDTIVKVTQKETAQARSEMMERSRDRLRNHRDTSKIISLLEVIAGKPGGGHGGGMLTGMLTGGLLEYLLTKMKFKKKPNIKDLVRDADGRWRDPKTGKYVKAPVESNRKPGLWDKIFNKKGAAKVATATEETAAKGGGKFLSGLGKVFKNPVTKAVVKGGGKLLRVAGKVALPISAAMGIFDAVHGMRDADNILGRKTTSSEKVGVGVAEAVNGALLGLPDWISNKVFGRGFSKLMLDGLDDIGKKIRETVSSIWTNTKDFVGNTLGTVSGVISGGVEGVLKYAKQITDAGGELMQAVSRMDIKGSVAALGKLAKLLVINPTKAVVGGVVTGAKAVATGAVAGGRAVAKFVGAGLGAVSSFFETGGRGAGTVSSGKGDHGGASYGTYQLASKNGSLQSFLKSSGYASQFAGMAPGSSEFNNKWKELARTDPEFAKAQQKYISDTHYSPLMAKLARSGIDLSGRGKAVQEAVFSTAVQYGAGTSIINKALAGKDVSRMSDAEIVSAIQDYKAANVATNFRRSSASVQAGVASRIGREKAILLGMATNPTSNSTMQVSSSFAGAKVLASSNTNSMTSASAPPSSSTPSTMSVMADQSYQPLAEELPQPKPQVTQDELRRPTEDLKALLAKASTSVTPNPSASGRRSGGLPKVADVADRPRIDLQAISTTLYARG